MIPTDPKHELPPGPAATHHSPLEPPPGQLYWAWKRRDGSLSGLSMRRESACPKMLFLFDGGRWVRVRIVEVAE